MLDSIDSSWRLWKLKKHRFFVSCCFYTVSTLLFVHAISLEHDFILYFYFFRFNSQELTVGFSLAVQCCWHYFVKGKNKKTTFLLRIYILIPFLWTVPYSYSNIQYCHRILSTVVGGYSYFINFKVEDLTTFSVAI